MIEVKPAAAACRQSTRERMGGGGRKELFERITSLGALRLRMDDGHADQISALNPTRRFHTDCDVSNATRDEY